MINSVRPHWLPENYKGKEVNITEAVSFKSAADATVLYLVAHRRLLNPGQWPLIAGIPMTDVQLTDIDGQPVDRALQSDDHVRIDLPGPGPASGGGYDWVRVAGKWENDSPSADRSIGFSLQVASNPMDYDKQAAHFFEKGGSSNFWLRLMENQVVMSYFGRNEVANTKTPGLRDKVRNSIVGVTAKAGFSEVFWKSLVSNLLVNKQRKQ